MEQTDQHSWQDEIRKRLIALFGSDQESDQESLIRILYYLAEEDKAYYNIGISPVWRTLKSAMSTDRVFKGYAERLAEDTKKAETDPDFRKVMADLYANMMEASETPMDDDYAHGWQLVSSDKRLMTGASVGFARAWSLIPVASQAQILQLIPKVITNRAALSTIDEVVGLVNKIGGPSVMVTLAVAYLSYEATKNLCRWHKGEISGKRCAKNMIDATVSIAAGLGGGIVGGAIGSVAGPVGTIVGGIAGSVLSTAAAGTLCDWFTQYLFDLPKEEALENAYNFLGVNMRASNAEINTAFRQLCLKHHPDKGGSAEQFHKLQVCMGVIRVSREEQY